MFRGERERQRPPITEKTYARKRIRVVSPHYLDREVHVIFDEHSQLVVKNFTKDETGFEGDINRVELRKSGHHRLICEFVRTGVREGQYVYEVHSPHGLVGEMLTKRLTNLDLAVAALFVTDSSTLNRRIGAASRFMPDGRVKAFIQSTDTVARAHRNTPVNC